MTLPIGKTPYMLVGLTGFLILVLFTISVYLLVAVYRLKKWKILSIQLVISIFLYLTEHFILSIQDYLIRERTTNFWKVYVDLFRQVPFILPAILVCLIAWEEILLYKSILKINRSSITQSSVKEAVDGLPTGIMCCLESGRILLVNAVYQDFCQKVYGEVPVNGLDLKRHLDEGSFSSDCSLEKREDTYIVSFYQETYYSVQFEKRVFENLLTTIALVSDVTEEVQKNIELEERGKKLIALNNELLERNRKIVSMIAEKEVLNAKMHIHNELGSTLIRLRSFLEGEKDVQSEAQMVAQLKDTVRFLRSEEESEVIDECSLMISTAKKLGVNVEVTGFIPSEEQARHIIACGIHECFTNTIRHAHGNMLFLKIEETDPWIRVQFTNNGYQPDETVKERGGLKSLRILTEKSGGSMEIRSVPRFQLILRLRKEETNG